MKWLKIPLQDLITLKEVGYLGEGGEFQICPD